MKTVTVSVKTTDIEELAMFLDDAVDGYKQSGEGIASYKLNPSPSAEAARLRAMCSTLAAAISSALQSAEEMGMECPAEDHLREALKAYETL